MKSNKVGQIVLMVVLLGALAVSTSIMIKNLNPPRRKPTNNSATSASTVSEATDSAKNASAQASERNGKVRRTAGGVSDVSEEESEFKDPLLNPNAFQVHEVKPSRNPFIQRLDWYEDELSEQLPGYPELAQSEFFEGMDLYLPDLEFLNEKDISSFSINRRRDNKYQISGESKDGQIQTQISFEEDIPDQASFTWDKASGIPLEALKDPAYVRQVMANQSQEGEQQPGDVPIPSGRYPGTMPGTDGSGSPLRNPGEIQGMVTAEGTIISCKGVNVESDRASALLLINGVVQLVTTGQVLPPRYRVQEITPEGVVLEDIQDETIDFIRLENPAQ